MARTTSAWVDIHETEVQAFIRPGGNVNDLLNRMAGHGRRYSYLYILGGHVRSGRLLGGLFSNLAKDTGPLTAFSRFGSSAKHTWYFMSDTLPTVSGSPFMLVPKFRGTMHVSPATKGAGSDLYLAWNAAGRPKRGRGFYRAQTVSGYRAHPFLAEGRIYSFAKERLIPR